MIRAYAARVGDEETLASDCAVAPPTFVLSLRRGFSPDVALPPESFAMYGGHDLTFHAALRAGHRYEVRARVIDSYEKSGRTGHMLIVVRRAEITDQQGRLVTEMIERQVVRRRSPESNVLSPEVAEVNRGELSTQDSALELSTQDSALSTSVDVGDSLGPTLRRAPSPADITGYANDNHVYESLFVEQAFARRLGYRDVIVPGPMQTAFLEQFLRRQLPGWSLDSIGITFRMSVITDDWIKLSGVITELQENESGATVTCDLVIETADGERATTGHASLTKVLSRKS